MVKDGWPARSTYLGIWTHGVPPGAEIHLSCIRKTAIIWSYELRLSSTTCQNDRNKKLYPSVTNFAGFGNISEAKNGLQNCVSDDLIVGAYSPSVFHPSMSAPTTTYWDNNVQNNAIIIPFARQKAYLSVLHRRRRLFGRTKTPQK